MILVHKLTDGGAERVAALWANGFVERGYIVNVITFDDSCSKTYSVDEQVMVSNVVPRSNNRLLRVTERIKRLRHALIQIQPDIVIEVMPSWQHLVAMIGLKCLKISTEHNSFERPHNAGRKLSWFRKYLLNSLYNHVTVLTEVDKKIIGNRLKNVTVLPNPLALVTVQSVPSKERVVLAVGRKDSWHCKGFDNLITAWANIASDNRGWKLIIVGGSNRGGQVYLEGLCQELGVSDSVEFPDYQSDIQPYYQRASIFVLSSRYEGFGLVLIEAMSQGCACVACDYKGRQSEIVTNGVDGVTCEPDDVEALAAKIKAVMVDDELRSLLQTNAIRRAADFKLEHIMDKWEEILRHCRDKMINDR